MKLLPKIVLALVMTTFSTSNAFNTLVPLNKEIVYEYKAIIKAGTHYPASYASQFLLHGKLHLQTDGNGTFAKLMDLTYQLYNGVLDHQHEHEANDVPLPKEVEELQKVFKIFYDLDGKAVGIATEANEKHRAPIPTVTNGAKYRKNYTIYYDDNLNTGDLWQIAVYDSDHEVSNRSFLHNPFTQQSIKNFNSLLSYYWTSYNHWMQYLYVMPEPGVHGFMIRVAPSHLQAVPVTSVDISIRVNVEQNNSTIYNTGSQLTTQLTYAAKDGEKNLKFWNVNAILDTNPGHTVNNLKMHLTRIVPGLRNYTICVDGDKKWDNNQVAGSLKVAKTESPDGKCFNEDTVIDVEMVGKKSYEQEHELNVYGDCQYPIPYSVPRYHTLQCLVAHTSLRHYTYKIKTSENTKEFMKFFWQWWNYLKSHYMWHYNSYEEHHEDVGKDNLVLDVVYPMEGKKVDVSLTTAEHKYEFNELPIHHWQWFEMSPDSTMYSKSFIYGHSLGIFDHCYVDFDRYHVNHDDVVIKSVPSDWTLYLGSDSTSSPSHSVYVKHIVDKKIGLKLGYNIHTLEFVPKEDITSYEITKDGQTSLTLDLEHHENWVSYQVLNHERPHSIIIFLPKSGLHLIYNGHQVVVIGSNHRWRGYCSNI